MSKIYCDFDIKKNLIANFISTWKDGDGWWDWDKDRSVVGYIVLAMLFPIILLLTIIFLPFQYLFSFKVRKNK